MKEGWMKNDECWSMMISSCWGVLWRWTDRQTNKQTDLCECRVAFATEKIGFRLVELK